MAGDAACALRLPGHQALARDSPLASPRLDMHAMLAAGVFALAFVAGSLVVDAGVPRRPTLSLVHAVLRVALGVVLLTPVLVLLAHVGAFVVPVIGAIGWLALLLWLA